MSEFILIKNADGSGQMLLRVERILRVYDSSGEGEGGGMVVYDDSEKEMAYMNTASTAAEVLEAIREARALARPGDYYSAPPHTLELLGGHTMTKEEYERRKGFEGSSK